jgi:hypothetical protein
MAVTVVSLGPTASGGSKSDFARDGDYTTGAYALATADGNQKMHDFRGFSGGSFYLDAARTLTFYAALAATPTTPRAAYDKDVTAIAMVCPAAGIYELPPELFGMQFIGIVANGAANITIVFKK